MNAHRKDREKGRYAAKTTVEACATLDINKLQREGALRPGRRSTSLFIKRHGSTKIAENLIGIACMKDGILIADAEQDCRSDKLSERIYPISIRWVPAGFGGRRPYFLCPGVSLPCDRPVIKLYKPPSEDRFACRHCYNLTYESRNISDPQRKAELRTKRAARKLNLTDPDEAYIMERPKGMHSRTFDRLRQAIFDAKAGEEEAWLEALGKKINHSQ
jgi:hypothetical protein